MKQQKKKHPITLIEIMIVIFLIGLIGSVLGYNMKGSLEEGKAFKTEQAINQIHDLLLLEVAKGESIDQVVKNPEQHLANSGFVKNVKSLLKDGWGGVYTMRVTRNQQDIVIKSSNLDRHHAKKGRVVAEPEEEQEAIAVYIP